MGLFEITKSGLKEREVAQFAALGLYERADLQRFLRDKIEALGEDLLVIAEEFGEWEDARRRIDLLAVDKAGRLVVIELKRTDDGGHMELQALRYAAMVSSMQFDEVVAAAYAVICQSIVQAKRSTPVRELEDFLEDGDADEAAISSDVRIILVSADFGREITTAVLWLNRFDGMDIRCVRLVPYDLDGQVLLDIQQVLPLPEAADYQVKLRRKEVARERAKTVGRDLSRFHIVVDGNELPAENKRNAMRLMIATLVGKGVPIAAIKAVLPPTRFRVLPGVHGPGEPTRVALSDEHPHVVADRFFCEDPFIDDEAQRTYVLTKMWGPKTEPLLQTLVQQFPEAKVGLKRAE